jgi:hypothetical protein
VLYIKNIFSIDNKQANSSTFHGVLVLYVKKRWKQTHGWWLFFQQYTMGAASGFPHNYKLTNRSYFFSGRWNDGRFCNTDIDAMIKRGLGTWQIPSYQSCGTYNERDDRTSSPSNASLFCIIDYDIIIQLLLLMVLLFWMRAICFCSYKFQVFFFTPSFISVFCKRIFFLFSAYAHYNHCETKVTNST